MTFRKMIEEDRVALHLRPLCAHPAWIEIDTNQFRKNLSAIRSLIGKSLFCLPVKANAYGHGLSQVGKIAEAAGVDSLGVSCLKEAVELRLAGISIPIVIFGAIHEDQIDDLIEFDLEFSISSKYKAELVAKKIGKGLRKCKVHLEIDTGMRRTGVRPENALSLLSFVGRLGCFDIVGVYSHLATSDVPNDPFAIHQIDVFRSLADELKRRGIICHLANSGGVAYYPDSVFDMVRPGLLAYGYFPDGKIDEAGVIAPCLSLKAKISYFKVVQKGAGISYGHAYRTEDETRIVTVPVGYGDGYRRSLSKKGAVLIRGERFPIAGTICMDQFMVDIDEREAFVGEEAVLIGKQGKEEITLWELSRMADSIPHEMLVAFSDRLPRIFL
jgi:alanine racemase